MVPKKKKKKRRSAADLFAVNLVKLSSLVYIVHVRQSELWVFRLPMG